MLMPKINIVQLKRYMIINVLKSYSWDVLSLNPCPELFCSCLESGLNRTRDCRNPSIPWKTFMALSLVRLRFLSFFCSLVARQLLYVALSIQALTWAYPSSISGESFSIRPYCPHASTTTSNGFISASAWEKNKWKLFSCYPLRQKLWFHGVDFFFS